MSYETAYHESMWDDIRTPATGINLTGPSAPASMDETECALSFANNADNVVALIIHTPHGLDRSKPIKPHIHCYARVNPVTAKTVNWRLEYKVYQHNQVVPANWTTVNVVQTLTADDYNQSAVVSFGSIDLSGLTSLAGFVKAKISRIVAGQTYTSPVFVDEIDFHYASNIEGSFGEWSNDV